MPDRPSRRPPWRLLVPVFLALSGCTGAQGLVEALSHDRATACATVQTIWGSAAMLRGNPELPPGFDGTAELSVASGGCTVKLTTVSPPSAPVLVIAPAP